MSIELIDKRKLIEKVKKFHKWCIHTDSFPMIPSKRDNVGYLADDVLFGIDLEPTVKAIPKADYENRLKADMLSMLTEIQLEIEELDSRAGYDGNGMPTFSTDYIRKNKVNELIQQKIDKLKEVER